MRGSGGSPILFNGTLELTVELLDLMMVSGRPPFAKFFTNTTQVPSWLTTTVAWSMSESCILVGRNDVFIDEIIRSLRV